MQKFNPEHWDYIQATSVSMNDPITLTAGGNGCGCCGDSITIKDVQLAIEAARAWANKLLQDAAKWQAWADEVERTGQLSELY